MECRIVQGMIESSMANNFPEQIETKASDGVKLCAYLFRPEGKPIAAVLAGHAMMVNAKSLDRPKGAGFLSYLAKQGFLVLGADLRGHGNSGTPVSQGGNWSYDDLVQKDVPAFLELARSFAPDKKIIVIGHSLFAHAATAWLGLNPGAPIDAMVLVSSNLWLRRDEPKFTNRIKKDFQIAAMSLLFHLFGCFPAKKLKMGTDDEAAGYLRQFLNVYYKSAWTSADGKIDYRAVLNNIKTPLLVVTGKGDTLWCTPYSARNFHKNVPERWIAFWNVGKGNFGLDFDPGHMDILTKARSEPLWKAISDWIKNSLQL